MVYTFDHADAPSTHHEQYFELHSNRAYYKDGWWASTTPEAMPWIHTDTKVDPTKFHWQLYDLTKDYSQSRNVASRHPAKLEELQSGFDAAARQNHVYPLMSDIFTRLAPGLKPDILEGRSRFTYYPGETRYPGPTFPFIRPQWSMTSHIELTQGLAEGPILIQGDQFAAWDCCSKAAGPRSCTTQPVEPKNAWRFRHRRP